MSWILVATLASLLWATSNVIDEILIKDQKRNPLALLVINGVLTTIPAFILWHGQSLASIDLSTVGLGIITGIVGFLAAYPYYRSLQTTNASSAVLMWNLGPVLVALLALVFLQDHLPWWSYLAGFLLISSSIIAGISSISKKRKSWYAAGWMLLASLSVAVEAILQKFLFQRTSFAFGLLFMSFGIVIMVGIITLASKRVRTELKNVVRKRDGLLELCNEGVTASAGFLSSLAISLGPVSFVKAISGIQPIFVILLSLALAIFTKKHRNHYKKTKWKTHAVATMLAVIGLALMGGE